MNEFTDVSLAFMFMDDGCKHNKNSYNIATICFEKENIEDFMDFLFDKFKLETTLYTRRVLNIRAKCSRLFEEIVYPHMVDCTKYKLI